MAVQTPRADATAQSRKDVSITYAMKTTRPGEHVKFDDIVEFRSKKDAPSSTRSRVVGVDKLTVRPDANTLSGSGGAPPTSTGRASDLSDTGAHARGARPAPTRYKWRGKGWLVITSSRWQVLGCSRDVSPANAQAWAVTYFEKTLFTPAGLDVYARTPRGLPGELLGAIVAQVRALGGDVAKLAERFFEVERSGVSSEPAPAAVPLTVAASDASKVDADADALERRSETGTEEETGERGEGAARAR